MRRQSFEDEREDDSPCASVSQSRVVFTYDSFRRSFLRSYVPSFVPSFLCRLFSLQVSVYVMSNWICAEHKEGGREGGEGTLHRSLFGGVKCWDEGNVCKYILTTFELVLLNIERNATIIDKLLTSYDSPSCILFLPYVSMEHSQPKTQETGKHAAS